MANHDYGFESLQTASHCRLTMFTTEVHAVRGVWWVLHGCCVSFAMSRQTTQVDGSTKLPCALYHELQSFLYVELITPLSATKFTVFFLSQPQTRQNLISRQVFIRLADFCLWKRRHFASMYVVATYAHRTVVCQDKRGYYPRTAFLT